MKSERILHIPNRISVLHHVRIGLSFFIKNYTNSLWQNRIVLAVDEALSNIIQHGYKNKEKDIIILTLSRNTNGFNFKIEDHAREFKGLDSEINSKGYGLSIINKIMDVERITSESGNILILKKNFNDMEDNI